jgi:hypothetical protein
MANTPEMKNTKTAVYLCSPRLTGRTGPLAYSLHFPNLNSSRCGSKKARIDE